MARRISNPVLAFALLGLLSPGAARAQDAPPQIWATPAIIASCLAPACDATRFAVEAIDGARHELRIQFYSFTSPSIAAAIVRARQRGVNVALLLDKTSPCQHGAVADQVKAAGIPVAIDSTVRIAHDKVVVIDRDRVIEGSFSASRAAVKNAENTNLVISPAVAEAYRAQWVLHAAASVPYLDRSRSCRARIREAFAARHIVGGF